MPVQNKSPPVRKYDHSATRIAGIRTKNRSNEDDNNQAYNDKYY